MFSAVTDTYELAEFEGPYGPARLVVLRTDAGPCVEAHRVPTRPLPDENAILLLETLGAIARNVHDAQERPPRVLPLRAGRPSSTPRWSAGGRPVSSASRCRSPVPPFPSPPATVGAGGGGTQVPELEWWIPLASLAQAAYGDSRSTNASRRARGRWGASGSPSSPAPSSTTAASGPTSRRTDRREGLAAEFQRARLVLEGADPAAVAAAGPSRPLPLARRISIFGRKSWLRDAEIANVLTLLLLRAGAGGRIKALYPMHVEIVTSLLLRYARADEARRARRALGAAERGTQGGSSGGHWTLLAVDGASKQTRFWDSLGGPPDPRLERACKAAFPRSAGRGRSGSPRRSRRR